MELSENAKSLALQLFSQYDGHISARILLQQVCSWGCAEHGSSSVFTGLHCASFFGIAALVDALMGMESCGINKRDSVGVTPLIWAAMCGHQDVVKLFLGRGEVDLDVPDGAYGRTALSWAKTNGHEGVVKLLLGREGVDPYGPDDNTGSWTKRSRAAF
jgi:ankyrin repeat protein